MEKISRESRNNSSPSIFNEMENGRYPAKKIANALRQAANIIENIEDIPVEGSKDAEYLVDTNAKRVALLLFAKKALKIRDKRAGIFPSDEFFGEPCWDMLLDLTVCSLSGTRVSTTAACIAARVPPTTALRWISVLENYGLIRRIPDDFDGRRSWIKMTNKGLEMMLAYYESIKEFA